MSSRIISVGSRASERQAFARFAGELRALTEEEAVAVELLASSGELDEWANAAFDGLSLEQRDAVRLHVIEERSYAETSELLGLSEPAVRARVSRGLRSLRRAASGHREGRR